jgi:amidohydrolase
MRNALNEERIMDEAQRIQEELVSIRRDLHAHPEIAFNEIRTARVVREKLEQLGIEVIPEVGVTGVIGILRGGFPGKTILLRADMDCLAMDEHNEVEYKSQNEGMMHSCGHDAHTAWLLGCAMVLSKMKDEIHGTVKFLFQPAEESFGGASKMIEDNAMENPKVDAAVAAHVVPELPSGMIGLGVRTASAAYFKITVKGKGAGSGSPHCSIDPIAIAAHMYMGLQTVVSRKTNPSEAVALSVCKFHAGTAYNIIPEQAELIGTIRSQSSEATEKVRKDMEDMIKGVTAAHGGSYELEYRHVCPPIINDTFLTDLVGESSSQLIGEDRVARLDIQSMGGEDFAFFSERVPSTYFVVGSMNEEKGLVNRPAHSPTFDMDEDILHETSAVLAKIAIDYLRS